MKLFPRFLLEGEGGAGSGGGGGGPAFTPSFDGALAADGSFADGWTAKAFGPDYKGPLASAKNFGDVNKMLTDSMTAARAKTEGMVRVPGADARPEDIAAFHKALGVPEKPEDYTYALPEGLKPEHINTKIIDGWRAEFKALGIPKATAEKLIHKQLSDEAAAIKVRTDEFNKGMEAEKADLAKRFPEIDKTVALAKSLATRKDVPESLKTAIAGGAFDPTNQGAFWGANALEAFAWAAKATGEDSGAGSGGAGGGGIENAAWAKDVVTNKSNPLNAKYHAGDKDVMGRVSKAYAVA